MTWGALFMYYECPVCGHKFKYDISLIATFGEEFGNCPSCKVPGTLVGEGPVTGNALEYEEID